MKQSHYGFVVVFVITMVMPVHAQSPYIGVVGGVNFADLTIEFVDKTITDYDIRSQTLFGVGGIVGIAVNEYVSLQLEPMYVRKGGIYTRSPAPGMSITSNQIDVPLLVKAGIGEKVRPYIMGGVFVSFVLDASIELDMAGRTWEGDLTQVLKSTEYGVLLGAGISFPIWKGVTFIEGRYALGLSNLNEGGTINISSGSLVLEGPQTDPGDVIKTKGLQIMVGFQLPIGAE
jgi:hypothetical protein